MRFPLYFFFLFSAVIASHSAPASSHARRALRLRDIVGDLGGVVGGLVPIPDIVGGSSSTPNSTPGSVSAAPSGSDTSSGEPSTITPAPSASTGNGGLLPGVVSDASNVVSNAGSVVSGAGSVVSGVTSAAGSAASDVVSGVTSAAGSAVSDVSSAVSSNAPALTSLLPPTSVDTSSTVPTSTSGAPSGSSDAPTSAPTSAPASASSSGGLLSSILGITSDILPPPTTTSSAPPDTLTFPPTTSSAPSDTASAPPPTSTTTDGGILSNVISQVSSIVSQATSVLPPATTDLPASIPTSVPPITSNVLSSALSIPPLITSEVPSSLPSGVPLITSGVPSSVPSSVPPFSEAPSSAPSGLPSSAASSQPPDNTSVASSVQPSIVFPTSIVSASESVSAAPSSAHSNSAPPASATTSSAISVDPGLSFVLTETSLALSSIATVTSQGTLTDPDQATTTINPSVAAATTLSVAALPTGIPARIYPQNQLSPDTDLSGYTLISILFNQQLNWPFVVNDPISSSQIFALLPVVISTALGIPGDDVKTWALQVFVPASYLSPADQSVLGTMWLGYIPTNQVDNLAAQIKAQQSAFYTAVPDPVAEALAAHVNAGFSLTSVADPNHSPGSSGSSGPPGTTGSTSNDGKAREDAIIGVVSALGAIAVLVLVFLVYRSMKRRKELAHRRLSEPPADVVAGTRPEGREFDQDSVGGARRRSFYYAEDSLRGYQGERADEVLPNPQMTQRRPVVPSAISAPILTQSSMNW